MATPGLPASFGPVEVARGEVTPYHIQFALARRPQVSWQNLGKMLRVCAHDLRRRCEGDAIEPAGVKRKPKRAAEPVSFNGYRPEPPRRGRGVLPDTAEHQVLTLLAMGLGTAAEMAPQLRREPGNVSSLLITLKNKGLVRRIGRAYPAQLTDEGVAEFERLKALMAAGGYGEGEGE